MQVPQLATHLLKTPSEVDCKFLSCQLKKKFSTDIAFAYDSEKIHENASERIACALVEFGNRHLLNTMLECHTLSRE